VRCTQIIGLTNEARKYIHDNVKQVSDLKCPKCHTTVTQKIVSRIYKDASDRGMFDDGPMLEEYTLNDGKKVREIIQATPWSSGPCIFMCLENEKGERMFEWAQEDIDDA